VTAAITRGDTIRIRPDKGPERVMTVSHVEHHIITLSDPAHLQSCGCLVNDAGAHRKGCPDHPEGVNPRENAR
jgi:hypothetical protein